MENFLASDVLLKLYHYFIIRRFLHFLVLVINFKGILHKGYFIVIRFHFV